MVHPSKVFTFWRFYRMPYGSHCVCDRNDILAPWPACMTHEVLGSLNPSNAEATFIQHTMTRRFLKNT